MKITGNKTEFALLNTMKNSEALGQKGEDIACMALKKDRCTIVEKNYRYRQWELDIIADDRGKVVCFVEVNAKSSFGLGLPEEAVTRNKQKKLEAAAYSYLTSKTGWIEGYALRCRFRGSGR